MAVSKVFSPTVIETKQDLLAALRRGELQCSKYNILSEEQKMFVELIAFGNYTGEQAIKLLRPGVTHADVVANRLMTLPNVADTLEELTTARDKKFLSEAISARDAALAKLKYIMNHSQEQKLQLEAAKIILERVNDYFRIRKKKDDEDGINRVVFQIQTGGGDVNFAQNPIVRPYADEAVLIPVEEVPVEYPPINDDPQCSDRPLPIAKAEPAKKKVPPAARLPGPKKEEESPTGYVLVYEGVNNYAKATDKPEGSEDEEG